MTTSTQTIFQDVAPLIFLGIRYTEDYHTATRSGISDFPETLPGTADWYSLFTNEVIVRETPLEEISELRELEMVASQKKEADFIEVAQRIDWSRRAADDFVDGIQMAMLAGAYLYARRIATMGSRQYPNHPRLKKLADLLAPPKMIVKNLPPDPSLRANREWLKLHKKEYQGYWVALRDGTLIAHAVTLSQLRAQIGRAEDTLVTKVG